MVVPLAAWWPELCCFLERERVVLFKHFWNYEAVAILSACSRVLRLETGYCSFWACWPSGWGPSLRYCGCCCNCYVLSWVPPVLRLAGLVAFLVWDLALWGLQSPIISTRYCYNWCCWICSLTCYAWLSYDIALLLCSPAGWFGALSPFELDFNFVISIECLTPSVRFFILILYEATLVFWPITWESSFLLKFWRDCLWTTGESWSAASNASAS